MRTPQLVIAWGRGAVRRPLANLAIVAGLAVMSVATVASLVSGDALARLFVADAEAEWGAVDLEVRAEDDAVMELGATRRLAEELVGEAAVVPRLVLQAAVRAGDRVEPGVSLLGLGPEESALPAPAPVAGIADVADLPTDHVILNERLARRLDVAVGDQVEVVAAVPRWFEEVPTSSTEVMHPPSTLRLPLTVAGIAADDGVADLHRRGTAIVDRSRLAGLAGLPQQVSVAHVAVTDLDGRTREEAADDLVGRLAHLTAVLELDVATVRSDQLAAADEEGGLFRSILLMLSVLVVAAAVVATRGLLVTLVEERSRDLAVLRAMGARRRTVVWLVAVQAAALGVLGGVLGLLGGVPFGQLIARLLSAHFAALGAARGREQVVLDATVSPSVAVTGVAIVTLVAVLAGVSAGRQAADSPVAGLLRGGPLPDRVPGRRRAALIAVAGAYLLGAGSTGGGPLVYVGLSVLGVAWWTWSRAGVPAGPARERLDRRAALAGLAWSTLGAAALGDPAAGVQAGFGVLAVAGIGAISCATVLAAPHLRGVMRVVRTYLPLGPAQAALATAAAQASRVRRRSTTTILTFGAALFMVAALSVLGSAQALPVDRQAGGYDVLVDGVGTLEDRTLAAIPGVERADPVADAVLSETSYAVETSSGARTTVPYPVHLTVPSRAFAAGQRFGLADAVAGVDSAGEALERVALERGHAVLDRAALPEGAAVGDEVVIDVGPSPRRLTIAAVLDTFLLSTVFINDVDLGQVAEYRGPNRAFVVAAAGTEPDQLAVQMEESLRDEGVTARTVARLREDVVAVNRTFTDVFALMLLLALAVAATTVAAYVVRAGRERRAELAVLRALGWRTSTLRLMLLGEPVLTGVTGIVLGIGVGLGTLSGLFALGYSDLAFVVDWPRLVIALGGSALLLVVCSGVAAAVATPRDIAAGLRDVG